MHITSIYNKIFFFIFFAMVFAYDMNLNLDFLKYFAIGITIIATIINLRGKFPKRKFELMILMLFPLIVSSLFQNTTFPQKLTSFVFYITFLVWMLFGDNILTTIDSVYYSVLGVCSGTFAVIITSWSMMYTQLANIYNSRQRVWWAFPHANTLGSIASASIVALICFLIFKKNKLSKLRLLVVIAEFTFMSVILIGTRSRTSEITIVIFLTVLLFSRLRKFSKLVRIVSYSLIILGIVFGSVFFIKEYALSDAAFEARLLIFQRLQTNLQTTIVGNGMVDFANLNTQNANGASGEIAAVMLFYKNGIIGLIVYVVVFATLFFQISSVQDKTRKTVSYALMFSVLVGSLGEALIVNITNVSPMLTLMLMSSVIFNTRWDGAESDKSELLEVNKS